MKLNLKLLKRLYLIDHPSGHENDMISFIINYCYKIPKLTFYMDHYNNLFITKNTTDPEYYPCVVAHLDCVLSYKCKELILKDNIITGRNPANGEPVALGADDANGILVALQLLEAVPDLKVCFTTEEELGGKGASEAIFNLDFFSDVSYFVQADRRNNEDLIIGTNGIYSASDDFLKDIEQVVVKYNYFDTYGTFTDVGIFAEELKISGINVSCGYTMEHTKFESCNIVDLEKCLNFIYEIIGTIKLTKVYNISVKSLYSQYKNDKFNYLPVYDSPKDDLDELPCDHCSTFDCMNCTKYQGY